MMSVTWTKESSTPSQTPIRLPSYVQIVTISMDTSFRLSHIYKMFVFFLLLGCYRIFSCLLAHRMNFSIVIVFVNPVLFGNTKKRDTGDPCLNRNKTKNDRYWQACVCTMSVKYTRWLQLPLFIYAAKTAMDTTWRLGGVGLHKHFTTIQSIILSSKY